MTWVTAAAMPQEVAVPGQPGHGPAQANPWFFFAAGIWFIILVIHALRAYLGPPVGPLGRYFRRPIAKAELDREVERLKGRR